MVFSRFALELVALEHYVPIRVHVRAGGRFAGSDETRRDGHGSTNHNSRSTNQCISMISSTKKYERKDNCERNQGLIEKWLYDVRSMYGSQSGKQRSETVQKSKREEFTLRKSQSSLFVNLICEYLFRIQHHSTHNYIHKIDSLIHEERVLVRVRFVQRTQEYKVDCSQNDHHTHQHPYPCWCRLYTF